MLWIWPIIAMILAVWLITLVVRLVRKFMIERVSKTENSTRGEKGSRQKWELVKRRAMELAINEGKRPEDTERNICFAPNVNSWDFKRCEIPTIH